VTNGDSAADTLAETGLEGRVLPWRDVLNEGPVPPLAPADLRAVRAEFIAARGWAAHDEVEADLRARDETLAGSLGSEPVVLWFEHDLYDQLQLLQILARVPPALADSDDLQMIVVDRFLGELTAAELAALWPRRVPLTSAALSDARDVFAAFTAPDPSALGARGCAPDGPLPYLADALTRLLEEYPAAGDGLGRGERKALAVIAGGADTPTAAFRAAQALEQAPYSGDVQFFDLLDELATEPEPLLERRPALRLTAAGHAVLAGADRIALRGIDRWIGGVHLHGTPAWRWDRDARRLSPTPRRLGGSSSGA
jgi:hypothetical protein